MLLYQYLTALPPIPAHLTVDPEVRDESRIGFRDNEYTRWPARPELLEWLRKNISEHIDIAGVQIITDNVPLHCDKRKWALNYLVELGGDVTTSFHKLPGQTVLQPPASRAWDAVDSEELCSVKFESNRWHILNTNVLHRVDGVTGNRVAVTIGLNADNPFELISGYQGLTGF
jgi:hypothetical protein